MPGLGEGLESLECKGNVAGPVFGVVIRLKLIRPGGRQTAALRFKARPAVSVQVKGVTGAILMGDTDDLDIVDLDGGSDSAGVIWGDGEGHRNVRILIICELARRKEAAGAGAILDVELSLVGIHTNTSLI